MTRWMLVPLSLVALVVVTPTSEAGLFGRKKSCNTVSDCGPTQCIVGYKTEKKLVTVNEWVTEKQKVNVTEYKYEEEKRKVTSYKSEQVKEVRMEKYWVCEPITTEQTREYTVHVEVKENRKGTRQVCRPVTTEETREYTMYTEVRENKKGTRQVCRPITTEETVKRTYDRGHWETTTCEVPCYTSSRRGFCCKKSCESECVTYKTVCQKHWVSKLETVEEKVKVTRNQFVEEPYEYVAISHKPEKRSEKVKVTRNQMVEEPYEYVVCSYKPETKSEKVKVTTYQKVEKAREVAYWVCKTTPVTEEITVKVCKPITVEKLIDVSVCRPVTKEIEVKTPIYGVVECAAPAPVYYECAPAKKGCCK